MPSQCPLWDKSCGPHQRFQDQDAWPVAMDVTPNWREASANRSKPVEDFEVRKWIQGQQAARDVKEEWEPSHTTAHTETRNMFVSPVNTGIEHHWYTDTVAWPLTIPNWAATSMINKHRSHSWYPTHACGDAPKLDGNQKQSETIRNKHAIKYNQVKWNRQLLHFSTSNMSISMNLWSSKYVK